MGMAESDRDSFEFQLLRSRIFPLDDEAIGRLNDEHECYIYGL